MTREICHVYHLEYMGPASLDGFSSLVGAYKDSLIYGDRLTLIFNNVGNKVRVTSLENSSVCYDFDNSELHRIVSVYDGVVGIISDFDNTMITFTIAYS